MERDTCLNCNKEFPVSELYYGNDPYAEEIYNELVETVLCKECYQNHLDDI